MTDRLSTSRQPEGGKLEEVLVLAYFYEPCSLTASHRVKGWTRHLASFGFRPIVVTRRWDEPVVSPMDLCKPTGDRLQVESDRAYEVFRTPFSGSLRDRLHTRFGARFAILRKGLSALEQYTNLIWVRQSAYRPIWQQARVILAERPWINKVVVTTHPFELLGIAHALKREFPHIQWLADYRDDWTTSELAVGYQKRFLRFARFFEKRWLSNAQRITSVSEYYVSKIAGLVDKPGSVLFNGYDGDPDREMLTDQPAGQKGDDPDRLVITYNGTLYGSQPIEIFLEGVRLFDLAFPGTIEIRFPGLAYDPVQEKRVVEAIAGIPNLSVKITPRIPRNEVLDWQRTSDVLLMVSHKGLRGIPSSKLYEYIQLKKPVLLVPNDHDVIRDTLEHCRLGLFADTAEEVFAQLRTYWMDKSRNRLPDFRGDEEAIRTYSRRSQAGVLGALLEQLDS